MSFCPRIAGGGKYPAGKEPEKTEVMADKGSMREEHSRKDGLHDCMGDRNALCPWGESTMRERERIKRKRSEVLYVEARIGSAWGNEWKNEKGHYGKRTE